MPVFVLGFLSNHARLPGRAANFGLAQLLRIDGRLPGDRCEPVPARSAPAGRCPALASPFQPPSQTARSSSAFEPQLPVL